MSIMIRDCVYSQNGDIFDKPVFAICNRTESEVKLSLDN